LYTTLEGKISEEYRIRLQRPDSQKGGDQKKRKGSGDKKRIVGERGDMRKKGNDWVGGMIDVVRMQGVRSNTAEKEKRRVVAVKTDKGQHSSVRSLRAGLGNRNGGFKMSIQLKG